ncbi:TSUP family transporter [Microbacterium karelineae]|uniref:TSUP family transporter n=1 Tax=Microbacterium karelineae TaxID=2654283 RepID=UPI0012EAFCBD|nr:TSUP family transporter [Microbacterium karelineae]
MPDIDLLTIALLIVAGLVAGWVDAVVGGGGLVQLPAMMLVPGIAPLQALATNKVASIMGTSVAAVTFARRVRPDPRTAIPLAVMALLGAIVGAMIATFIPEEAFTPIILVVLIAVGAFTVLKPKMGVHANRRWHGARHVIAAALIGLAVGTYDGALGPGTGSFFVILLVSVLGYAFMPASALGKIANFCTNLGALIFFVPAGHVLWGLGLAVGAANLVGGYIGARMAVSKGSRFVRIVFIVVVAVLILKLAYDLVMGS